VSDCEREHKAHGYCRTHYRRWQRHGDPLADVALPGPGTGYRTALARVRAARGGPEVLGCAECGGPAVVWSYDGCCPHERVEPGRGRRYSLDPGRYRPRCRFCHRRAVVDRAEPVAPPPRVAGPAMDVERAVRLYAAGATASGIAGLLRVSPDAVLRALRAREVPIRPARGRYSSRIS
jgi:transposase-like protein